ncbi:MAG: lipid II flippase MurJ, partial [Patescibacteria group bacterium]
NLLRVMLMAQIFFCISGFLTGMIQSHERFLIPAIAPLAYNLGIILGIVFLSKTLGIYAPAVGMVLGAALHMLIQLPAALSLGFRPSLSFNIRYPGVWEVARLMPPRALAMGIDQIEQFVAIMLSSLLAAGSLSLFNVARLLYAVPTLLFGATIGQAALPSLSAYVAKQDWESFRKTLTNACLQVVFLALPVCVLFIILRIPIVRLVFGAKTFPWEATLLTGKTMAILMISAVFYAVTQLVIRAYYAMHDTKTPLIIGLAGAVFNVLFSVLSVKLWGWGILGIAFAISFTAIGEMVVLTTVLALKVFPEKRMPMEVWLPLGKMGIIGIVMGFGLWLPMRLLDQYIFDTTRTLPLLFLTIITSAIGMTVYLTLSWVFKISQLSSVFGLFRRINDWRTYLKAPAQSEPIILPTSEQN